MDGKSLTRFAKGQKAVRTHGSQSQAPASTALPQPLPGMAWAWNGTQYVMVPLAAPAVPVQAEPHPFAPQFQQQYPHVPATPGFAPVIPINRPAPAARSNYMVRDGSGDHWAQHLAGMPDVPVQQVPGTYGYDAMEGNPSPLSEEALRPLLAESPEFASHHAQDARSSMRVDRTFRPQPDIVDKGAGKD